MNNKTIKIISGNFYFLFLGLYFSYGQVFYPSDVFTGKAQNKYWVFFTDKNGTSFNPHDYFDAKTIENRHNQNIELSDSTDFPVNDNYLLAIGKGVDSVSFVTRWFNGISVYATEKQIAQIKKLPFVKEVETILMESEIAWLNTNTANKVPENKFDTALNETKRFLLDNQTKRMGRADFEKAGMDGKGIRIAVFDAGFPTVDINPAFEHLRKDNRILKTWDFVKNKEFVYGFNSHGTMVLSCIAGKINEQKIGLATGAEFILARTEMAQREPFAEEEYWLAAAEWADKNGANIISSSLAYTYHRYFRKDMNGKKSLVARAALMAASKGILVVNAAGNDGKNEWKIIATPSDADSVMAVGGINPYSDYHINFSSFGPTADKRMKPNVCAFGQVIASGKAGLEETFGTSFATPLVAGFAACAWQTKRNLTNMELFGEIEKSCHLYPYFDYAHGFGIPQASFFTDNPSPPTLPTFEFVADKYSLKVIIKDSLPDARNESFQNVNEAVEKAVSEYQNYFFYHIVNPSGYLDNYYVLSVEKQEVLNLNLESFKKGQKIRVFYKGYSETYSF